MHTHTYRHVHSHTHTLTHAHSYIHICSLIHTLTHTYIYTHRHTHTYTHVHSHTHAHMHTHRHNHTYTHARSHTHTQAHTHTRHPDRGTCLPPACSTSRPRALQHSCPRFPSAPLMKPQRAETAYCDSKPLIPHRSGRDLSRLHVNVRKAVCGNSPHLCIIITALDRGTYSRESSPV